MYLYKFTTVAHVYQCIYTTIAVMVVNLKEEKIYFQKTTYKNDI
ncbi:hypothetical protein [Peribacillus asahii]|nr:hypothetical protein [Peribacillus asahii]